MLVWKYPNKFGISLAYSYLCISKFKQYNYYA